MLKIVIIFLYLNLRIFFQKNRLIEMFFEGAKYMFWLKNKNNFQILSGDKNISILHMSCRTSDLQFSLVLQTYALVLLKHML